VFGLWLEEWKGGGNLRIPLGRRWWFLTRGVSLVLVDGWNPLSSRVDEIKNRKVTVSNLAEQYKKQLNATLETAVELTECLTNTWKDELGERQWDQEKKAYVRRLHPEEDRLIHEMKGALTKFNEALANVASSFFRNLDEMKDRPLTFCTPEEQSRLDQIAKTKEEYKVIRTEYSDAMIDLETELDSSGEANPKTEERVEASKERYEQKSEELTRVALNYESLFRDELSQRITAHFTAQMHFVRGINAAYKDFYPLTKSLGLDWQDIRARRKADARETTEDDDDDFRQHSAAALPDGPGIPTGKQVSRNPFDSALASGSGPAVLSGDPGSARVRDQSQNSIGRSDTAPRVDASEFYDMNQSNRKGSPGVSSDLNLDTVHL